MKAGGATQCEAIAIGGSAGALAVLTELTEALPAGFRLPILVCLHLHPSDRGQMARLLDEHGALPAIEVYDKMPVDQGRIHVAPANYHLLVERERTLALSADAKVNHCRPSIDVLFDSAARAYGAQLLAILLSGANEDGAAGMGAVLARGGLTVAQRPDTAEMPIMPRTAMDAGNVAAVLTPAEINALVVRLHDNPVLDGTVGGRRA